jgi:hypothetical protein
MNDQVRFFFDRFTGERREVVDLVAEPRRAVTSG